MTESKDLTPTDSERNSSFGARFGNLVRSYREDLGMSLSELAIRVWDDVTRKATLSRLENGRIINPQAKTVQLVAFALDIDQDEIDRLHNSSDSQSTDLEQQIGQLPQQSRDQLEALASRFEIGDAYKFTNDELRVMLERKAEEYRSYRKQLMLLDDRQEEIIAAKSAANAAAEKMQFDQVDQHLQVADRLQTLLAVETKEARATHALMRGLVDDAYSIFVSAAEALREADLREMALRRDKYCQQMFQHDLKYGGNALPLALELQRPGVIALENTPWHTEWAKVLSNQATVMARHADQSKDPQSTELLHEAVTAYRKLLEYYTAEEMSDMCAMTQQNLAGALYQLSKKPVEASKRSRLLEESITLLKDALIIRREDRVPDEWAMTVQNMSIALRELGCLKGGESGRHFLKESVNAGQAALTVRTRDKNLYDWAMTKESLAATEHELAIHDLTNDRPSHFSAAKAHIDDVLRNVEEKSAPAVFARALKVQKTISTSYSNGQV